MRTTATLIASIVSVLGISASADAGLIAYWNFNTYDETTSGTSLSANQGSGTLSLASWTGALDNFAGSTINAISPDVAGNSLSLIAGGAAAPFPGNGSFIEFAISTVGQQDIVLTFATRGTSTGFNSGQWSYDAGSGFVNVGGNTATTSTTFALQTVDFSAEAGIENQASVIVRYTVSGATSSSGNNRIDNVQFNGTDIPAPGALALLGIAGLVGSRRRR